MIRWLLVFICFGTLLVLAGTLFEGYILKFQVDNEFNRNNAINTLVNSESFRQASLEQQIYQLSVNELAYDMARESLQIQQSIFFLLLSTGAVILSSVLALYFFLLSHRFNKKTRDIAKNAQTLSFLGL
jgi:hypothetical protein